MTTREIINNSFLHRVPELLKQGLSFDDAVKKAYYDELDLLAELSDSQSFTRTDRVSNLLNKLAIEFHAEVNI